MAADVGTGTGQFIVGNRRVAVKLELGIDNDFNLFRQERIGSALVMLASGHFEVTGCTGGVAVAVCHCQGTGQVSLDTVRTAATGVVLKLCSRVVAIDTKTSHVGNRRIAVANVTAANRFKGECCFGILVLVAIKTPLAVVTSAKAGVAFVLNRAVAISDGSCMTDLAETVVLAVWSWLGGDEAGRDVFQRNRQAVDLGLQHVIVGRTVDIMTRGTHCGHLVGC